MIGSTNTSPARPLSLFILFSLSLLFLLFAFSAFGNPHNQEALNDKTSTGEIDEVTNWGAGDLNLNGIPFEIADAILYSNYFMYGLSVFTIDINAQIAASEINGDGLPLTVADFIYMLRVIDGTYVSPPDSAIPNPSFSGTVGKVERGGTLVITTNFEERVGGLRLTFALPAGAAEGNLNPVLLPGAEHMDMQYNISGDSMYVMIYKMSGTPSNEIGTTIADGPCEILQFNNVDSSPEIIGAAAAGFDGAPALVELQNNAIFQRGDINLDGINYTIADMVLMMNYLISYGIDAFTINPSEQLANGDINADLVTINIQDLHFMSRVIDGTLFPLEYPQNYEIVYDTIYASFFRKLNFGTYSVEAYLEDTVGALYFAYYVPSITDTSTISISLHQDINHMELAYGFHHDSLLIAIYDMPDGDEFSNVIEPGQYEIFQINYENSENLQFVYAEGSGYDGDYVKLEDYTLYDRGDVNLNGISNEIADFITMENYLFSDGINALNIDPYTQLLQGDVNADGVKLNIQDLHYIGRIIEGTFPPIMIPDWERVVYDTIPVAYSMLPTDSSITIRTQLSDSVAALYFVFNAPYLPSPDYLEITLLSGASDMKLSYGVHNDSLVVAIYNWPGEPVNMIAPGIQDIIHIDFGEFSIPDMIYANGSGYNGEYVKMELSNIPNAPPVFDNYPGRIINDYYGGFQIDLNATDPDYDGGFLEYQIIEGPGSIDPNSGIFTYSGVCQNINDSFAVVICAEDAFNPCPQQSDIYHAEINLVIENQPPALGDANGDGEILLTDITILIDYLYDDGPSPLPAADVMDVNGLPGVNLLDITYLIKFLYADGAEVVCP